MAPDSTADVGAGASGCASGSQTCSGTTPSLTANPIVNSHDSRAISAAGWCANATASEPNWKPPARADSVSNASATSAVLMCDSAR